MIHTVLLSLLGLAAATNNIVQEDNAGVTQNPEVQYTNPPVSTVQPITPASRVPATDPALPGSPFSPGIPGEGQQFGANQVAPQSSSESESSESESVETPTESPEDNTSESTESDSQSSEQTLESQDVTLEDMREEPTLGPLATPSALESLNPLGNQLPQHSDVEGVLGDDSQGSQENVRRSWLRVYKHNIYRQLSGGNIIGSVATEPAIAAVNNPTPASVLSAPAPTDSAASVSNESVEEAGLPALRECRETVDNGECIPHGDVNDDGTIDNDLQHGPLQLEEDQGHMTI